MFNIQDEKVQKLLFEGNFGLEKESLRVDEDGFLSKSAHPFGNNEHIVRDFCENQTEINTGVSDSADGAVKELEGYTKEIHEVLSSLEKPELLWPFSNPPYIRNEDDIPIASFKGVETSKTEYRQFLADRYGRYKMTFSGIHVNFSFGDELLKEDFKLSGKKDFKEYKNEVYLTVAEQAAAYCWLLVAITAASPLMDGSYVEKKAYDEDEFSGMASVRSSELGYWNAFTPIFDYSNIENYAKSIQAYVDNGMLSAPSELYYPIRLKPRGKNNLEKLRNEGVDHIELRMFDLNPLEKAGLDVRDVKFAHLMMIWLASKERQKFEPKDQVQAVQHFKNAAHYDLKTVKIYTPDGEAYELADAALRVIKFMREFFEKYPNDKYYPEDVDNIFSFEEQKFIDAENRYAWQIRKKFSGGYVKKGLELARHLREEYLNV